MFDNVFKVNLHGLMYMITRYVQYNQTLCEYHAWWFNAEIF